MPRRGWVVAATVAGLAATLGVRVPPAFSDGDGPKATEPSSLFVRRVGYEPLDAVRFLSKEAKARGVKDVTVVFDEISVAPPPGRNEFNFEHRYRDDLSRWMNALEEWKGTSDLDLRAGTTTSPRPAKVGTAGWREAVFEQAYRPWWDEDGFHGFEPAATWVTRFLAQRGWLTDMPGPLNVMPDEAWIVLVGGNLTPERWVSAPMESDDEIEAHWRRLLVPVGKYWDEEHVGVQCRRAHTALWLVSPEARFGDFLPYSEMPDLPWMSRPAWPARRARTGIEWAPDDRPTTPGEGEFRRLLERLSRGATKARKSPSGLDLGDGDDVGRRFKSKTPYWYGSFTSSGERVFHTDVPSGYGTWPQARTALSTGGRYVFYPFAPGDFLDVLPYDGPLLSDLSPEYVTRWQFRERRHADPVMKALAAAEDMVFEGTPWADSPGWLADAKGWSGFASVSPPAVTEDWRERKKPYDIVERGNAGTLEAAGRRLAEVLPAYDRAIDLLDRTLWGVRNGAYPGLSRRSHANLLHARFGFAMSAFHLHALSMYMQEIVRFRPADADAHSWEYVVTYVPTIRMSDVLDGYEGRILPASGEIDFASPPRALKGYQGNLLSVPESSPWYRAVRAPDRVLENLDARLVPDAFRLISAGRDVMESFGRSPWGAVVYYSEAYTFVWKPMRNLMGNVGPAPSGKKDKRPSSPVTPRDPTPSTPGGPITGGG